jgi:hypothetical protein
LIFENSYDEATTVLVNIQWKDFDLEANLIAITDYSDNYFPYFELDRHYHKFYDRKLECMKRNLK